MNGKVVCLNCSPLVGSITGIERCIYENIKRIDKLAEKDGILIELLYPEGTTPNFPKLDYLKTVSLPSNGNKIQILSLIKYIKNRNAVYFSIHGGICLIKGSVICTNDMRTWVHKEFDPFGFRLKCNINALTSKIFAKKIVTISKTARSEISKCLKISEESITIISPGWEHVKDVKPDEKIWKKIQGIEKGNYFYSLSSRAPHKNFVWIHEVAKRNPDQIFIIGGKPWRNDSADAPIKNLFYLGYISDAENVELMTHCKAFLHPSKYEGFGMTPLEALACGAKICISNASCLPEVFGNCAYYFDPDDYDIDLNRLLDKRVESSEKVLQKYNWEKSSLQWYSLMKEEYFD